MTVPSVQTAAQATDGTQTLAVAPPTPAEAAAAAAALSPSSAAAETAAASAAATGAIQWTPAKVAATLGLFIFAGLAGASCVVGDAAWKLAARDNPALTLPSALRPKHKNAEIGGGWLVWQAVRGGRPRWWLAPGFAVLCCYGLIPTLQPPEAGFARVYAVYGGAFIALSYAWGAAVDGARPDAGDYAGGALALAGVLLAWFWPRR